MTAFKRAVPFSRGCTLNETDGSFSVGGVAFPWKGGILLLLRLGEYKLCPFLFALRHTSVAADVALGHDLTVCLGLPEFLALQISDWFCQISPKSVSSTDHAILSELAYSESFPSAGGKPQRPGAVERSQLVQW